MGGLQSRTTSVESFHWGTEGAQERARTWPDRIRKGEPGAFHALFLRHSGELLGFVHCALGDMERSERVVQDAFVDLYRSRHRVVSGTSPRSELYRLVTIRVLDEVHGSGGADEAPERPDDARVLRALRRLPFPHRVALLLNRVPSLRTREIASWLRTPVDELRRLVLDASRRLAEELHGSCMAIREAS